VPSGDAGAGGPTHDQSAAPPPPPAGAWRTFVLAVRGGFSVEGPQHTTFPNVVAHLGDGRICHNARSLADLADFVAAPVESAVRAHALNLVRCAQQRPDAVMPPQWCMRLLQARWGPAALERFGISVATLLVMGL
jgi:hypothetical protein